MNAENKQASNTHTPCSHLLTDLVNCGVENNTRVITLSHEYHTKEAVVCFGLFLPRIPCHPVSLPWLSTLPDKSTSLHKPSLFRPSPYSCKVKTYDSNISLLCRASVDMMVPRGRRGGETASVMRMVAPHWCIVLYNVCVCAPWLRGHLHDNNFCMLLGWGGRLLL